MTRTVFDNAMVAHVWAQQQQTNGYSHNGNFWFETETIYSYRTAMATFVKPWHFGVGDKPILFINRDTYSVTTSRHQLYIQSAFNKSDRDRMVKVSGDFLQQLARNADFFTTDRFDSDVRRQYVADEVARNIAEAERLLVKASRARSRAGDYYSAALAFIATARKIGKLFKHRVYVPKILRDAEAGTVEGIEYFAARAIRADNMRKARLKQEAEKRDKAERERNESLFQDWLKGVGLYCPGTHIVTPAGGVYMRRVMNLKGGEDVLQTSLGATVPWKHAVRVFQALKAVRASGQPWQSNGRVLRVGHFRVDRIEANGDFAAGCHRFKWADIKPFAIAEGVFDIVASDAAIQRKRGAE